MDVIISNIALPIFEYQCIPRCIRDYSFYILPIVTCHNTQWLGLKLKGEKIKKKIMFKTHGTHLTTVNCERKSPIELTN